MMTPKMIFLLTLVGINLIDCQYLAPRCETCKYTPGKMFMTHEFCSVYIKCEWDRENPGLFSHDLVCCPANMVFDEQRYPPSCYFMQRAMDCNTNHFYGCPPVSEDTCPFRPHSSTNAMYQARVDRRWVDLPCGAGTVYIHDLCACGFPSATEDSCALLIDLDFDLNILSTACDLYVVAPIFGDAFMVSGVICFSGDEQFIEIEYLMNWFESKRDAFTVSFWFNAQTSTSRAGLFSSNCLWRLSGSPVELLLVDSEVAVVLGEMTQWKRIGWFIETNLWYHIAVTYDRGDYKVYFNGQLIYGLKTSGPLARTFTHSTLGYVERDMFFPGCMNDFLFYTVPLDEEQIYEHFVNRTRF